MGANGNPPPASQNGTHGGGSSTVQDGGGGGGDGGAGGSSAAGGNPSNGCAAAAAGSSATVQALKHNPGISLEWSAEEQSILEEGLNKYASDPSIVRYSKIAKQLPDKTVRDVALRCRWMTKKESGKRRKDDHNLSRKSKDKKERVTDPSTKSASHSTGRPNAPPYPLPMLPMDDDDISYKEIGGPTGELLEHNAQVLSQISNNLTNMQIQENITLFCQTRDNLLTILKEMNDVPEIMKQMPPLPVKLNEELANSILPQTSAPMQQS